ncbi:hybrid sensor histidine kinase/response regulator [Yeosuana aromativorans]|uniref:histidine kinase n=1 Tax=Yeosuana aromativorans TaxID=288019 RepID=A0A8J3BK53_9FLAO|nr:ATP-binding protein [Yeosuana aromativorans]GGK27426.1 hybrid sensor histidine kinase/response regulator [Yeosuana aromativorans]
MGKILKMVCLIVGFSVIFLGEAKAQQIKQLDSNDGLVNGAISAFAKDSLGYIWIGTDQGVCKYSGNTFKSYNLEKFNGFLSEGIVDIINLKGELYLIGSNGTIFKYLYDYDTLKPLKALSDKLFFSAAVLSDNQLLIGLQSGFLIYNINSNSYSDLLQPDVLNNRVVYVSKGKVYSATSRGVYVFDFNQKDETLIFKETFLNGKDVITISFDQKNRLWAGTEIGGLFVIENKSIQHIPISQISDKTYAIRKIEFDKNNNALIAIDRLGLFVLNDSFQIVKRYSYNPDNKNSITQNSIYGIYVDDSDAYWLGAREGGLNIIEEKDKIFTNISHVQNEVNSIQNNYIRAIFESPNGDIWFGTENGVSRLTTDEKWYNYNDDPKLFNTAVLAVNAFDDEILLGTYGEGLLQIEPQTGKVSEFHLKPELPLKLIFNISSFGQDLWIGGNDGPLSHYHDKKIVSNYKMGLVRSLIQGFDKIIYVGSYRGFFEINTRNGSTRTIHEKTFNTFNEIYSLNLDQLNNCIWIGSKNGFYKYNLSTESLELLSNKNNREIGTIYSIKKDNMHNLFLASNTGLWKFAIKKQIFRKYGQQDGLLVNEFGIGASAKFNDGRLAFGGPKGAVIFNPIDLIEDSPISDIFITDFQINGKSPDSLTLSKNINYVKSLKLNYDQNTISFNFGTIKFHGSNRNIFKWKLEGYDADYRENFGNEKIIYSNLSSGTYHLNVQGYNADGVKGQHDYNLTIYVKRPFWKSNIALILYFLGASLFFYLIFRITKANIRKKVDDNRIKFFIDVAHDIRTPVSLIQILVKQLSNQEDTKKSIELIQRNTENLNEYVTQLLDFQKIDRNQLKLSVSKVDLHECLEKIIEDFTPILQEKSIDIELNIKNIYAWFDKAKMSRIFYNLISNAIKYSNEGGEILISASLEKDTLKINFEDNGMGIPEKQQDLIFKRFTRGTNVSNKGIPGTGIGLMLSKKIIELHGGKILLESKENVGSKFTIVLPYGTKHFKNEDLRYENQKDEKFNNVDNLIHENKLILLVEDNEELRKAIKNELDKFYTIIEAEDGKEGLLIALSKSPDLVITDVMMPKMDGKELCNLLKTNFKTSHIPVIMLTALADIDDRLRGLETGADAYVEKPFNVEVLKLTINNLIKSRENIKRLLGGDTIAREKALSPDEVFLSEVIETIKDNITEHDFSIEKLCDIVGLSRSNLFRKLKGLIQMAPSDLIIKIKLNEAEDLMKTKRYTRISDIAYASGFQDPKYFSTLFKKYYGKTPKEFMAEQ